MNMIGYLIVFYILFNSCTLTFDMLEVMFQTLYESTNACAKVFIQVPTVALEANDKMLDTCICQFCYPILEK